MLHVSVIIVLREVLEASLLVSLFAIVSDTYRLPRYWLPTGLALGLLGAVGYSLGIDPISGWFDGVGQEVFNALFQFAIYLLILVTGLLLIQRTRNPQSSGNLVVLIMALTVALATTREGAEIAVYVYGYTGLFPQLATVIMGGLIGAFIGISIGILLYYGFRHPSIQRYPQIVFLFLSLFGAGLLLQATQSLMQADWLPSQLPVWNSDDWLPEKSLLGQLLYVLVGYEATPTSIQIFIYMSGLFFLMITTVLVGRAARSNDITQTGRP